MTKKQKEERERRILYTAKIAGMMLQGKSMYEVLEAFHAEPSKSNRRSCAKRLDAMFNR